MMCYNFFTKNNTTPHEKLDFVRVMLRKANARAQRAPPAKGMPRGKWSRLCAYAWMQGRACNARS